MHAACICKYAKSFSYMYYGMPLQLVRLCVYAHVSFMLAHDGGMHANMVISMWLMTYVWWCHACMSVALSFKWWHVHGYVNDGWTPNQNDMNVAYIQFHECMQTVMYVMLIISPLRACLQEHCITSPYYLVIFMRAIIFVAPAWQLISLEIFLVLFGFLFWFPLPSHVTWNRLPEKGDVLKPEKGDISKLQKFISSKTAAS